MAQAPCPDCGIEIELPPRAEIQDADCPACGFSLRSLADLAPEEAEEIPPPPPAESPCPFCGRPVPEGAMECPHGCGDIRTYDACPACGKPLDAPLRGRAHAVCSRDCHAEVAEELRPQIQKADDEFWKWIGWMCAGQIVLSATLGIAVSLVAVFMTRVLARRVWNVSGAHQTGRRALSYVFLVLSAMVGLWLRAGAMDPR